MLIRRHGNKKRHFWARVDAIAEQKGKIITRPICRQFVQRLKRRQRETKIEKRSMNSGREKGLKSRTGASVMFIIFLAGGQQTFKRHGTPSRRTFGLLDATDTCLCTSWASLARECAAFQSHSTLLGLQIFNVDLKSDSDKKNSLSSVSHPRIFLHIDDIIYNRLIFKKR